MLSIQMPGAFAIFIYQSFMSNTSVSAGLPYLISGIQQLILFSIILTFSMLALIVKMLRSMVLSRVEQFFDKYIFTTTMRAMVFGVLLRFNHINASSLTSIRSGRKMFFACHGTRPLGAQKTRWGGGSPRAMARVKHYTSASY